MIILLNNWLKNAKKLSLRAKCETFRAAIHASKTLLAISIFLSLGLLTYSNTTLSAPESPIGMIISTQGQVRAIDRQNKQRPLKRRSKIYLYDRIVTQKDSKAQLRLNDDSIIVVQSASEFYVSEFSFNKRFPRNNKYVGNIVKGALINISGQGKTENYKLNSPLVTIAFRGTGLATKLIGKRNVLINQEVYVFQGYVTVKNICENVIGPCTPTSINIGAGQKTNTAIVDRMGKIRTIKSSALVSEISGSLLIDDVLIEQKGGGIVVRCKGRR